VRVDPATHARITTKPSEMRLRLSLIDEHGYALGMRLFEKAIAEEQKRTTKALSAGTT
jgi:hypothetical protein